MTVKLVVLYTQPADAGDFDEHYLGVHGPLVDKVPGLQRWEGARFVAAADGGEQTYHRIAELWFEDMDALQAALGSAEGQATAGDYQQIAPPGSRMFIAAVD
ncbi:MAG: EthD family reductase [Jatrophihabitans sp.]|uniref:EthD family reductase n=1 Tax=Jatrophihabitans sp. TaxID=1932789 RepID=UPI003F7FEC90